MRTLYTFIAVLFLNILICPAQVTDVVTGINDPSRLLLDGNTLYYCTGSEIFKIDVTENSPTPISVLSGLNGVVGMTVDGNTLYFSEFNAGSISKIDLTDPNPTKETVIDGLNTPATIYLSGTTMYYSDANDNVVNKFDVTDPNPTTVLVATSNVNFSPTGLALQGDILYMGQGQANRVSKVDVTSGVTQPVDVVTGVQRPLGIRIVGNNLFMAEYIGNKVSIKNLTAGSGTAEDVVTGIDKPTDIEIWGNTLFIMERGANRIVKMELQLGVMEFNANRITLFPNPTSAFIEISNLRETTNYIIYAIDGSQVGTGTINPKEKIDVSNLSSGSYFLRTEHGAMAKFIKK
ncbi:T9SS type A sorting domain-containing protein [Aequorivita flava]|uniref:T9SS type A sorting domain-containing protein n=1 Tax=Aequorivita flava TaxID=3114371 RepID=A0AB35YUH0_9FLAO